MATFTHTITVADPPLVQDGNNPQVRISGGQAIGVNTPSTATTITLTLDDGSNQYLLTGTRSRIMELLKEMLSAIAGYGANPLP